jgi:hypothetical protein
MNTRIFALVALVGLSPPRWTLAGETPSAPVVDYTREIKPLLSKRCYDCHGALKHKAGLRLDTAALMRKGGDSGPAFEPGQSGESLIVDAVTGRDGWRMPPESEGARLSDQDIAKLKAWIDQGGKAPADERPQPDPRDHWAFRGPKRPEVPTAPALGALARWVSNPIDAFLAAQHLQHGLRPRPAADPATLIRRVTVDLTGLLPSPEVVSGFLADPSDRAYEAVVDRLLTSPQYGERWGRHWMDIWRYSDWDGFGAEVRESQPHIWRWRDWIVESLNRDMPYDRMIVAMLAADECEPCDAGALRATGFLVRNWYKFNRNVWLDDAIEHTAKAFLGMTFNCAKCHDHKYDPISQTDYYAFRAFFEPHTVRTDRVPGHPDTHEAGLVRIFDGQLATPTYLLQRGDEKHPVKDRPLAPSVPRILQYQAKLGPIKPMQVPARAYYPGLASFVREESIAQARRVIMARKAALIAAEAALAEAKSAAAAEKARFAAALAKKGLRAAEADLAALGARIAADEARYAEPPHSDAAARARAASRLERKHALLQAEEAVLRAEIAHRESTSAAPKQLGNAKGSPAEKEAAASLAKARQTAQAARRALTEDSPNYTPLTPIYPSTTSGRRLALARWIADPDNPLTARVAVNHIWMRHFGTPLVPTVFDFGRNGTPPSMPALLDWLAVQLRDHGGRMKPIHRLIVNSAAYRMQSNSGGPSDPNASHDPSNNYYWRMNPKRMEAEAVRDNVLYVAGSLDQIHGGPDVDPEAGLKSPRRSLYFRHAKEKRIAFLRLFDSPNVLSCYRRSESVAPQQALALANSSLSREQARLLATRLVQQLAREPSALNEDKFVAAAFERVLGRLPAAKESAACRAFLSTQTRQLADRTRMTRFPTGPASAILPAADPAQRAREDLVHVLLNHNDFLTIR